MANRANDLEAEDTLAAVLRFENGALGTIEATTAARPAWRGRWQWSRRSGRWRTEG
jgi:predicted dehydrogenase